MNSGLRTGLMVAVVALTFVSAVQGADIEWTSEPVDGIDVTNPPIPNADVQLILDDDSVEADFGVGGAAALPEGRVGEEVLLAGFEVVVHFGQDDGQVEGGGRDIRTARLLPVGSGETRTNQRRSGQRRPK